jgi:pyridoxine kinase
MLGEIKMKNCVPKIAAIHDISGIGRCSMTVILPILSSLGCQVCPLPTALLSNHSEYREFFFYDFTKHMEEYYNYWEKNNAEFDCIYSGFLGSEKQIDIIMDIIERVKVKTNSLVVIDPVMGDHGVTYKTYTSEMIEKMNELVTKADIITPNLTEVSILLKEEYSNDDISLESVKSKLRRLSDMGPNIVVITGIKTDLGEHINACYDSKLNKYWKIPFEHIGTRYPGTGDLFTSLLVGYLFNEKNLPQAIQLASKFITEAVKITYSSNAPHPEGVQFEKIMRVLYEKITEYKYKEI